MNLLGFDTATPVTSVAVGVKGAIVSEISITGEKTHMEQLLPIIHSSLAEASLKIGDIEGIAVGIGPGLFTGLRIGIATANTFSQILKIPIAGIDTLRILASGLAYRKGPIAAAIDARRGEVFAATFVSDGAVIKLIEPARAVDPSLFAQELARTDGRFSLVGDGFVKYAEVFKEVLGENAEQASPEFMYPRASALVSLAAPDLAGMPTGLPGIVMPTYVRNPDADELIKKMRS
jgi:tRNA threonylcarbamoyladenosine biosynthesis protein TsaB